MRQAFLSVAITLGLLGAAVATTDVSGADFTATTTSTAALGAPTLTGVHAPRDGIASFDANPSPLGCTASWSALVGGTEVADRVELLSEPGAAQLFETVDGDVGATAFEALTNATVSTYRLTTRAANSWISDVAETRTATCVDHGSVSVAAGPTATCGIRADTSLWCWGFGQDYATGDNDYFTTSSPRIESSASWRQAAVGVGHACGIQTDSTLWCWGDNWTGQVGDGTIIRRNDPVQIGSSTDWVSVGAAGYTTCGIRAPGTLWCWGRNEFGQLGNGTTNASLLPVRVGTESDWLSATNAPRHTCGVRATNELFCWGGNSDGQLGDGSTIDRHTPVSVGFPGDWSSSVAGGEQHTCGIQLDGSMWCWGTNWFGEAGAATSLPLLVPTRAGPDSDWAQVGAGRYYTCATKIDRTLWCSGSNFDGRTGLGTTTGRTTGFTQVQTESTWAVLSVGDRHSCAVRLDDSMWCWGSNNVGQVGQPDTTWQSPVVVNADSDWLEAKAGFNHTCALKVDQSLWCWGTNTSSQLGVNSRDDGFFEPTEVFGGATWNSHDAGDYHSCGVQTNGTLWCWGRNGKGQLGTGGSPTITDIPLQVGVDADWFTVTVGRQHSCGIRLDRTLWCWGNNSNGQIGDGTTTNAPSPVQAGIAANWQSVDAGLHHTCGNQQDGTLWCWGANGWGQVGDGTTSDRVAPTRVGTNSNWAMIGLGRDHSCATTTGGELWCWGRGSEGQLGDGTLSNHTAPAQIPGTAWASVDGAFNYSCGRQVDDTLWCWGRNAAGQFGSGSLGPVSPTPTQYHSGFASLTVSTGRFHTCGITVGGVLECWGSNTEGQLGYNSSVDSPVEVDGSHLWSS